MRVFADKKLHTKFRLQLCDGGRNGRGRYVDLLCRFDNRTRFTHSDNVFELPQCEATRHGRLFCQIAGGNPSAATYQYLIHVVFKAVQLKYGG